MNFKFRFYLRNSNSINLEILLIIQHYKELQAITAIFGLNKLFEIKSILNKGTSELSDKIEALEKDINLKPRTKPVIIDQTIKSPHWLSGFTSGDGCFKVSIRESKLCKAGGRVVLVFILTQHNRDEFLLNSMVNFFGCGQTFKYKDYVEFRCQSFKKNYENILPFFYKYPILGVKAQDFKDWTKVAEMIQTKVHLTKEGMDQIRQIRVGMNKGRYENS